MLAEVPDFSVESVFLRIFRQMKKSSRKIKEVMQMNIFETVKAAVTVRQAAEHYGLKINRSGMICCPFHDDRHPSLKLNEDYFYCFGCGAKGDVIDFVARLLDLSAYEAAQRLAADFGLDRPPSVVAQVKSVFFLSTDGAVSQNSSRPCRTLERGADNFLMFGRGRRSDRITLGEPLGRAHGTLQPVWMKVS